MGINLPRISLSARDGDSRSVAPPVEGVEGTAESKKSLDSPSFRARQPLPNMLPIYLVRERTCFRSREPGGSHPPRVRECDHGKSLAAGSSGTTSPSTAPHVRSQVFHTVYTVLSRHGHPAPWHFRPVPTPRAVPRTASRQLCGNVWKTRFRPGFRHQPRGRAGISLPHPSCSFPSIPQTAAGKRIRDGRVGHALSFFFSSPASSSNSLIVPFPTSLIEHFPLKTVPSSTISFAVLISPSIRAPV